jgi:hypothetical protein
LFTFLPLLLERDLVMLLTKHGKEEQAEKLIRGELKELNLNYCELGDDEAVKVAAFITVDDALEKVWLNVNKIGPRGAKAFADALKHNKKSLVSGSRPQSDWTGGCRCPYRCSRLHCLHDQAPRRPQQYRS